MRTRIRSTLRLLACSAALAGLMSTPGLAQTDEQPAAGMEAGSPDTTTDAAPAGSGTGSADGSGMAGTSENAAGAMSQMEEAPDAAGEEAGEAMETDDAPSTADTGSASDGTAAGADNAMADEDWMQSEWGPDDEIGAANRLTPETTQKAAGLVTEGKVYSLGITVDSKTPAFAPRSLSVTILQPGQAGGGSLGPTKSTYNDDIFMGWLGIGSQIDGLGHLGVDGVYYNGNRQEDFANAAGLTKLGVEKIPPIVARGVMIDMAAHYGEEMLQEGTAYTREDIMAAAEEQNVTIEEGDVVLFHSGWLSLLDSEDEADLTRFGTVEPGLGKTGAEYLAELGVVAVGGDTWGLEAVPFEDGVGVFEIHQFLLAKNGIYILENMDTRELVADGVNEFMFVLGQTKLRGAVQMMINPVAIR